MDLIFIENPHHNNNSRYGLAVIDVFTKRATIVLLKKKDQASILEAVKTAFDRMGTPESVYADEGSEFISGAFKTFLNDNGVTLIITYSHAPFIERFNRTIKEMMDKYLQSKETKDIASVIDKLVDNYNSSYHSVIGMAPNDVNEDNMHIVQMNIIRHAKRNYKPPIYVGMSVRVKLKDKALKKGYKAKFSKSTYTVRKIDQPYYYLKGEDRPYLAAHLLPVDNVEVNPDKMPTLQTKARTKARAVEVNIPTPNIEERAIETRKRINRVVKTDFGTFVIDS